MTSFKLKFLNSNLTKKITIMIVVASIVTSLSCFGGVLLIQREYNQLLYSSLQGSLMSCGDKISQELDTIKGVTSNLVQNQYIRRDLISLQEPTSDIHIQNVSNSIESILRDQHSASPYIKYISFYSKDVQVTSFAPAEESVPYSIKENVLRKTDPTNSYITTIPDYCNTQGLFITRNILYIEDLAAKSLGTIVILVDLEKLISSSTKSILPNKHVDYLIYDNSEQLIYHTPSLKNSAYDYRNNANNESYRIQTIDKTKYFTMQGLIRKTDLRYVCLLSFTPIVKTVHFTTIWVLVFILITSILASVIAKHYVILISNDFELLIDKMEHFGNDLPYSCDIDYSNRHDEAALLHRQFDIMSNKINELIKQNYLNKLLVQEAQLRALQSQINPHFLYNVLEAIHWRAKAIEAKQISDMTESLGSLLRSTLSNHAFTGTIESELDIVHHYLRIQEIRFGTNRFAYKEVIDESLLTTPIPHMSIQPLVDNAMTYAMEVMIEICMITVTVKQDDSSIRIQVINTGSQFVEDLLMKIRNQEAITHGLGIALVNLDDRLRLHSDNKSYLNLYNIDEDTACAEIILNKEKL